MRKNTDPRKTSICLPQITQVAVPSVADQVFDVLQKRVLSLELPPRTKISEAEVARQMGVSRQPVREAFKRMAQLGFLSIRPQSGTTVTLISEDAILRARFIRTALEVKTCRTACEKISEAGIEKLHALLQDQRNAIRSDDKDQFHELDDQFHREICVQAGAEYVWDIIHNNKAHMDRIRMLSLDSSSRDHAFDEHITLLHAISARDADAAERIITAHLSRILTLIDKMKTENHGWFASRAN